MYNIYATDMVFEQCSSNKERIDSIIPYAVIHFVLSGEGYINGKRITKDMAFISFENSRMSYYPSETDPWSYIYLRLRGEDLRKAFLEHNFSLGLTVLPFAENDALFQILDLHRKLSDKDNNDEAKIIANLVFLLFSNHHKPPNAQAIQNKPQQHVERIAEFMKRNYYRKISMNDISKKFYLNKNYIRTIFVQQMGIPPKQYLKKLRMERAEFLLLQTNEDVSLIARSVGYDDALLFSKMFKQYHGISPKEYRLKNKT